MRTYLIILLIAFAYVNNDNSFAQVRVATSGKVGICGVTNPTSHLELANNKWIRLNAPSGYAGILFYETQGSSESDVQYGGKIFYDESADKLKIVTRQNNTDVYGLSIQRTYGYVGVRMTTPAYPLDVNGSVQATSFVATSDIRLKKDVASFDQQKSNSLLYLSAITYKPVFREVQSESILAEGDTLMKEFIKNKLREERTRIGFSAQEVQKYFPELVAEDDQGYLAVDYNGFIPVIVEAFKKQQLKIEELEKKIEALSVNKPK